MRVRADGRIAISHFEPVQIFADASLLGVKLETGRTHQIRAHAASIGHPVAGDRRYGDRDFNAWCRSLGLRRMFLHASRLAFISEELPYDVSAGLPPDLSLVLTALEGL
jgi:23S rRNA pseudouridine955/2504/2580 synthase